MSENEKLFEVLKDLQLDIKIFVISQLGKPTYDHWRKKLTE